MTGMDQEKQDAMDNARRMYASNRNLTNDEVEEYLGYEFVAGPVAIEDQVRRYFLMVKSQRPKKALQLLKETKPLLKRGVRTEQEVHDLSLVLARYISGFVINAPLTQEMRDEMAQEFPRPLKIITVMSEEPYFVWRGRSQLAKWKAWRQGRPTVLGYGMTEEEAVDDLRYRVQPDHDGTLDGLGSPKGPVIGGNMLSAGHVTHHNRGRFSQKN